MGKSVFLSILLSAAIALTGAFSGFEKADQAIGCQTTDDASPETNITAALGESLEADFYVKTQEDWTMLDPADYEIVSSNKEILLPERGQDGKVLLNFLSEGQTQLTVVNGENIKTLPVLTRPPLVAFYTGKEIKADSRITEFTFDKTNRTFYVLQDMQSGYGYNEFGVMQGNDLVEVDTTDIGNNIVKLTVRDHVTWAFNLTFYAKLIGDNGEKVLECVLKCKPA